MLAQRIIKFFAPIVIMVIVASYPCILAIDITAFQVRGKDIYIEGYITVDPTQVPDYLGYNYNDEGFLLYWETHINQILQEHGYGFIHVEDLELEWVEIGNAEGHDIIHFKIYV